MLVGVLSIRVRAEVAVGELTEGVMNMFVAVADIVVGVTVDMLAKVKVIVLDATGIDLEFTLPPSYAVDVLVDSWAEAVVGNIDVSIDARVKMLIDVLVSGALVGIIFGVVTDLRIVVFGDVDVLAATMTALAFTNSTSLEETLTFS